MPSSALKLSIFDLLASCFRSSCFYFLWAPHRTAKDWHGVWGGLAPLNIAVQAGWADGIHLLRRHARIQRAVAEHDEHGEQQPPPPHPPRPMPEVLSETAVLRLEVARLAAAAALAAEAAEDSQINVVVAERALRARQVAEVEARCGAEKAELERQVGELQRDVAALRGVE